MQLGKLRAVSALALSLGLGLGMHTACVAGGSSLTLKGSDTMVILGQAWAEAYMKSHEGSSISVQGGGSGTGISALINGMTDICESSRAMKDKEISQCKDRNFTPIAATVALDGISIAVSTSNPITSISEEQLKGIYTGRITNWRQVGGHDGQIVVLSRENTSGTYVYFQEHVLQNERYAPTVLTLPSTKAIQQEVTNNANAIGYGGVAYFHHKRNVKVIPVSKTKGSPAIEPTDANIKSGKYPISRPLYLYTAGRAKGLAADFIKFCLSPQGQETVERVGYVRVR